MNKKNLKYIFILIIILIGYSSKGQSNFHDKDNTSYYYLGIMDNSYSAESTTAFLNSNIYKNKDRTSIYYLEINTREYTNYSKNLKITKTSKDILGSKKDKEKFKKKKKKNFKLKLFNDWLIIALLISLILLAFVNFYHKKYITSIFISLLNYRAALKLKEDSNINTSRSGNILLILYFLNISILIYELIQYYSINLEINEILSFLLIFLIILSIYFVKLVIILFLSSIFEIKEIISEYIFNTKIFNQISGIILLPLIISIQYIGQNLTKYIIISSLIILLTVYITRIYRSIQIFFHKQFSILYLFLYFCSIEILPFIILIKLFLLNPYIP